MTTKTLTKEKREELMQACAELLRSSDVKPETVAGRRMIHAFWCGALRGADATEDPYVVICLMSGRHTDLIKQGEKQ